MSNKHKVALLLILSLFVSNFYAQQSVAGSVVDADTNLPLPFVNIGIIKKGVGTVSDEEGIFNFLFDSSILTPMDTLRVSSMGYKSYDVPVSQFFNQKQGSLSIRLAPEIMELSEVIVAASKRKQKSKTDKIEGYTYAGQLKNGTWEGDGALGGELVTTIKISKKLRRLNAFYFYILQNTSDSLLIRLNLYEGNTMYPEKKLTDQTILYTLKTKAGKVGIDLTSYDLEVRDDFSIGIELLKVYGSKLGLVVAGDDTPGVSFRRFTSQGDWKRYSQDALTFSVSTTLLEEDEEQFESAARSSTTNFSSSQLLNDPVATSSTINGYVFDEGEPVANVSVQNLTSGIVTATDNQGKYEIEATVNDELQFKVTGRQEEIRQVFESTFAINVSLEPDVIQLDDVTVTALGKKKRTQEELYQQFNEDKGIIKTSFGILDKETSGVSVKILDESDLNTGVASFGDMLRGKISGLSMLSNDNFDRTVNIFIRQNGTNRPIPVAYEIDGQIFTDYPAFLDPSLIKRIAVLPSLSAVAKYGSLGAGGMIIVNTKLSNFSPVTVSSAKNDGTKKVMDTDGKALSAEDIRKNWPDFLQELYSSKTINEARDIYEQNNVLYAINPSFNIDAVHYFSEQWPLETFTKELLAEKVTLFPKDASYLRALAFIADKTGRCEESLELYKKILLLRSNRAQSYRDLANAYIACGEEEKGTNLYARYFYLVQEGFFGKQPDALEEVINTELKNLLDFEEEELDPIAQMASKAATENRTRILLEWNDTAADISFKFIAPEGTISLWSNTEESDTMTKTAPKIFSSKDFLLYGNAKNWRLNSKYLGNTSGLATYLKVTVSYNYGTPQQKDDMTLYRLDIKDVFTEVLSIP